MRKFAGYVTTIIAPKEANRLLATFDFLLKNYTYPYVEGQHPPINPYSAVINTLIRMNSEQRILFHSGQAIINVVDSARGRVEVYDQERYEFEAELEFLAG